MIPGRPGGTFDLPALSTAAGRLAAWVAAGFLCTRGIADPDLWGHIRFGLDLLRSGHLSAIDPYSFTQDVPWVNHEWLSEAMLALAYRTSGVLGLVLLKVAVLAVAFALLAWVAFRAAGPARWWLLAAGIVGVAPAAVTFRPQLWTILALSILCCALTRRAWLYWIPPLFAVWANLHGGWIVGVTISALWLTGRLIDTRRVRAVLPGAAALAAAIVATLVNPYGWRLWTFLLATVRTTRNITEWRPLWQQEDASSLLLWVAVAIGIVGTTVIKRWDRMTWAAALPVAWLGIMSVFVTRLQPLFSLVAVFCLADAWQSRASARVPERLRPAGFLLVDAVVVVIVCGFNVLAASRCLFIRGSWAPDVEAASAFAAASVQGRLVLPFDWGEYALWHWGPRLRVSIDGRRETIYTDETIRTQSAVRVGGHEGLEFLRRVRPEYVWLPTAIAAPTEAWLLTNGYIVDVETRRSFVARRADLPPLGLGPPMSRCFP